MIQVSNEVSQKIYSGNAITHAKIVIDDRVFGYDNKNDTQAPVDDGSIYKLDIQYDISQNEFALGTACIQTCEVMLYGASDFEFEGKYLKVYIGYELDETFTVNGTEYPKIEWVPMGVFFTTEITKKGEWVSFVGYDRTYKYTDMVYVPSSSLGKKPTVYNVFMDIFKFTGAPYDADSFKNIMNTTVDMTLLYGTDTDGNTTGYTVRDAMAYLSGKAGGCIIVDRYDKFKFLEYSFAAIYTDIGDGMSFEEPYGITDDDISDAEIMGDGIHGMRYIDVMNSSAAVRYDNGNTDYKNGIVLDSPIITTENEAMLVLNHINNIYLWHGGTFYMTPCSFKLLSGDVTLELGDIISYVPKNTYALSEQTYIPIMHMGINYTGKPEIDIAAYNQTQTQQENRTGPLGRSFTAFKRAADNKYKYLDEAIEIVSNQITGADGGYIVVDKNEDGSWRQIRVLDSIEDTQSAILINKNGIGLSQDGGQTMNSAALTIDGKFVANSMTGAILQAAQGYIGGWTIDDTSMYSDYTDSNGNTYRAYIQNASVAGKSSWVFSTQQKSGNSFIGKFIVKVNGETYVPRLYDDKSRTLIAYNDDDGYFVYGLGAYQNNYDTYYEGNTIYLRYKNDLRIQEGTTTRFTFANVEWKFSDIDSSYVKRNTITTPGGFVLNANGGDNAIYLNANTTYAYCKFRIKNSLIVDGTIIANTGINVDGGSYINFGKNSDGVYLYGNSNNLYLSGSSYVQSKSQFRLNFKASSGTVPLAVGTSGQITTTSSSKRYKENITDELDDGLNPEKLYDLPVKQYNYKAEYSDIELVAGTQIGIIAEDVEKYYPNALIRNTEGEAESWQDRIMIPALLKLIQQQKKEIDELNKRLTEIEKLLPNKN